jgi:CelD/BcsL family acetyltransferase involved in cellulose biosynthesis
MSVRWKVQPARDLHMLRDQWQALNEAGSGSPALEPAFVLPLLDHFGDGTELLATASSGARTLAMTLLRRTAPGCWQTFQPSQMPMGPWLQQPGLPSAELVRGLFPALPGFPLLIGVTQLDPDILARPSSTPSLATLDYITTARITVTGSFDDYWEARGRNLKHNMKRQRSRLAREGVKTTLDILTAAHEIEAAVATYAELESAGWKAAGDTAIAPDNVQERFYRSMLKEFAAAGRARVYQYRFNERVVAVDLCIVGRGTLIMLKTTYDEGCKGLSPTFLMREEAFRGVFAEREVSRIEVYGRVTEWHSRWTDELRTMYHVNYCRWPAISATRRMMRLAKSLSS